jgi:hypothetical protein
VLHLGTYRAYTKEWCGSHAFSPESAPFFCVCPVYWCLRLTYICHKQSYVSGTTRKYRKVTIDWNYKPTCMLTPLPVSDFEHFNTSDFCYTYALFSRSRNCNDFVNVNFIYPLKARKHVDFTFKKISS